MEYSEDRFREILEDIYVDSLGRGWDVDEDAADLIDEYIKMHDIDTEALVSCLRRRNLTKRYLKQNAEQRYKERIESDRQWYSIKSQREGNLERNCIE